MDDPLNGQVEVQAPLSEGDALALILQQRELREQLAALQARWNSHVEALIPPARAAPLEDPAVAAYYRPVPKAPTRFKSVAAAKAAQDKQAWRNLRQKIAAPAQHLKVAPTRKEAMSKDTPTPPGPAQPALSLIQGRAPRAPEPIDPLCGAEAAAFLGEPPDDVIARYPDLAPGYQQLYDAKAFAQRNHPGHETAFIQAAIDAVASKIERGAPLTDDLFYEAKTNGDRRNAAPPKAEVLQLVRPAPQLAPDTPPPASKESSMENDSAAPAPTDIPLSLTGEAAAEQADFERAYGVSSSYAYLAEVGEIMPAEEAATLAKNLIEDIRAIKSAEYRQDALSDSHAIGLMQPLYQAEFARLAPDLVAAAQAAYNAGDGWEPFASDAPAPVPADGAPITPEAVTPILEKAAKKSNRRNENWGPELPMPPSATLAGVPVFTAISPTLEEAAALRAIAATAASMNAWRQDSVPLAATKDTVATDLMQLRAITDQPTRNAALLAMHGSAIAQVQYKVALTWQDEKTWREIQAAAQREQQLRDVPPFVTATAEAVAVPPPVAAAAMQPDAKRVQELRDAEAVLLVDQQDIETLRGNTDLKARIRIDSGWDNAAEFQEFTDAQYAGNARRLTAIREEPATAGEPFEAPPEVDEQTRLFRQVAGDAGYAMSGPGGGMEQPEAKDMVADHLATLAKIDNEHLRNLTTDVILEAAHAQQHYRAELLEQSPELHAAYLALASKSQHQGTKFHAEQARSQSLDAAALAQLEAARARDRQSVEKQLGWNTIERADSAERVPLDKPAAVAATAAAASAPAVDVALTAVPPEVERAYLHVGNKFYLTSNKKHVAFEDHGATLKAALDTGKVTLSMVQIAQARGWTDIKVSGTEDFRQEAWREAALRGIAVTGYTPNALDQADLARRMPAKPLNVVAPAQSAQTGIYISAEDAAILAVVKAQRAAGASPAPTAAATPATAPATTAAAAKPPAGDTLIAHGPAKYRNDPTNADSYYVTLKSEAGKQRTIWGIGLQEAIATAGVKIGDQITLVKNGEKAVEVEANVKNDDGTAIVGTKRIGATRNEWVVKAQAFAAQPPEQAVVTHPELASMLGIAMAIDKRAEADGYTPAARAIIEARVKQNLTNSIERGDIKGVKLSEVLDVKPEVQQAMTQ